MEANDEISLDLETLRDKHFHVPLKQSNAI